MKDHLRPVGKPAPPRPRRPDAFISEMIQSLPFSMMALVPSQAPRCRAPFEAPVAEAVEIGEDAVLVGKHHLSPFGGALSLAAPETSGSVRRVPVSTTVSGVAMDCALSLGATDSHLGTGRRTGGALVISLVEAGDRLAVVLARACRSRSLEAPARPTRRTRSERSGRRPARMSCGHSAGRCGPGCRRPDRRAAVLKVSGVRSS